MCLLCFQFRNVLVSSFSEKLSDFVFKNELFHYAFDDGDGGNAEKSKKYFHDDDAPRLCQNNILRVSALKI